MKVQTGRGTMPLIILIAIWSVSALCALPGLAVSPILGKLSVIFPHATELDIQMLTSLPSLLAIPFILLSGKLTERMNNILLLRTGLWIFLLSGILYLLCNKMWQLIVVSALLGIGAGLIVPLSTGLISFYFIGTYRMKQFGYSSVIMNLTLVLATTLTGYLAEISWHLPFIVYLFPLFSIILSYSLHGSISVSQSSTENSDSNKTTATPKEERGASLTFGRYGMDVKKLLAVMGFYGFVTYLVLVVTFNLPFLMEEYGLDSGNAGILISLFFLAIMAPGFVLDKIVMKQKRYTKFWSLLEIALGLICILVSRSELSMELGVVFMGFGYGVIQPLIYEQTSRLAIPRKVTMALAWVMAMNYVAILVCPFIVDFFQQLLQVKSQQFAFGFNLVLVTFALIGLWPMRESSLFNDDIES